MQLKDTLIAVGAILIWSVNLVIQKVFSQEIPLDLFNVLRLLASVPLLVFFRTPPADLKKLFHTTFFWNVLPFFFVGMGLEYGTDVGSAAFIYQTCSFFGVLFCFLLLKEIPKLYQIAGMILSFFGVCLLFGHAVSGVTPAYFFGLLCILCAAMSWGMGVTLIKKYSLPADLGTNIWMMSIAALPMCAIVFLKGGSAFFTSSLKVLSLETTLAVAYAAYVANVMGNCLWFRLLKKYPSSLITPFMLLMPPFSCAISFFLLGERFTLLQISAFIVIILGMCINQNILKIRRKYARSAHLVFF